MKCQGVTSVSIHTITAPEVKNGCMILQTCLSVSQLYLCLAFPEFWYGSNKVMLVCSWSMDLGWDEKIVWSLCSISTLENQESRCGWANSPWNKFFNNVESLSPWALWTLSWHMRMGLLCRKTAVMASEASELLMLLPAFLPFLWLPTVTIDFYHCLLPWPSFFKAVSGSLFIYLLDSGS